MTAKTSRRWVLGAAIVGFGLLTLLASIIFGAPSLAGIGLAAFLIGLLTLYLPSQPSVTPELVDAYALPSMENLERFLRELASDSKATYLTLKDRSDRLKVFIPVDDNPASYPPEQQDQDQLIALSNDPHRTGLFLDAPGASLLTLMEKESGLDFFGLGREKLEEALRTGLVESLEVAADVKCSYTNNQMRLRIRDGDVKIGRTIAHTIPKTTARLGCPTCSAAICAAAKATKKNVVVENVSHEGKYHDLTLTFTGGEAEHAAH